MHPYARVGYLGILTAVFLLSCGYFVSRSILDGFTRIERQNVLSEVGWVMLDLESEGVDLGDFANEIGTLPEALAFFENPNATFMSDYLDPVTAEVMLFDFAALYNANHEYVAGVRYDVGLSGQSELTEEPSRVLGERLRGYEIESGTAKIDLMTLDSNLYLVATHSVFDLEDADQTTVGSVMIGRRLPIGFDEFEGAMGTIYSLISMREVSAWTGEGDRLLREDVYPVVDEEFMEDDGFDALETLNAEGEGDWEFVEFDVDLGVIEETQYYRLAEAETGPDGLSKTVVMCSLGGAASETDIVMKVMVPQTISNLASQKAALVTGALWISMALTVGFTWFAVREIRRRLGAEQSVRSANLQLEQANAQKDRLFSIIGHDMRAPLNGVIRLSELMTRAPDSFAADDVKRFANNINVTGKQLHGLLENLLNWARLQTEQLPFDPVGLDLSTVIRQVVSLYQPRVDEKALELDVDVPDGMTVRADREMLKTILRNLISNAIKFTPPGGSVNVSGSELDGFVRISVSDTGQGMTEEQRLRVFDLKPETIDRSQPEEENGSGFGLLLCHEMVRRHESELEVYSEVGIGSEFSFSLPSA